MQPLSSPHSEYSTWKSAPRGCLQLLNNPSPSAEQVSQHRDLQQSSDRAAVHDWLAPQPECGHECWSNITRKPGTSHGRASFHLCASRLLEPAALPFPGIPLHTCAGWTPCAAPGPAHRCGPASLTHTGEERWALSWGCFTPQTWASRWEKTAEGGETVHRLVGQGMSGWKTAERPASPPAHLHEARAAVLMQGQSPQQLHWSCKAKSRERFPCSAEHLPFPVGTHGYKEILEIPEAMIEGRVKQLQFPSQSIHQSITSTVVSRYQPKVQRPTQILVLLLIILYNWVYHVEKISTYMDTLECVSVLGERQLGRLEEVRP